MFLLPRHLFFLIGFIVLISIERTFGLPMISLLLACLYLWPTHRLIKTVGILVCGSLIAVNYFLPFGIGILAIAILLFFLEKQFQFIQNKTITYWFFLILVTTGVGCFSHQLLTLQTLLYHLVMATVAGVVIRFWFTKKIDKWKLL
jgi:hypothetical protein